MSLFGPIWAYLSPSGLGLSGRIQAYLGLNEPVWAYLSVSGRKFAPIRAYLGLSARAYLGLSGLI